jgi:hypothetical protein
MTSTKEAYTENLSNKPNPAISSLVSFIEDTDLNPLKKHLTIERKILADKLISLNKQCADTLTLTNELDKLVNQHNQPLLLECLTALKKQWLGMLRQTVQLQEQISQYDVVLKTLQLHLECVGDLHN